MHRLGLADAMAARHGLQVVLRVPVRIEHDDSVGRCEVDADAARAGSDHEYEGFGGGVRKAVNSGLPFAPRHGAVEALVAPPAPAYEVFNQVQHLAACLEAQACLRSALAGQRSAPRPRPQAWRVCVAKDPHRYARQAWQARASMTPTPAAQAPTARSRGSAKGGYSSGAASLRHQGLLHGLQALLDVSLLAPQQVRLEQFIELVHLLHRAITRRKRAEVVEEGVEIAKLLSVEEVKDGPQFRHPAARAQLAHGFDDLRIAVLELVPLVDDQVGPLDLHERLRLLDDGLEGGDDDVEAVAHLALGRGLTPVILQDNAPRVGGTVEDDCVRVGPRSRLPFPVRDG
eukprot:scaffold328920_cov52-Tisochrysis_lutea.AAC.6